MNVDISEAKKLVFESDGGQIFVKTDEDCYPDTKVSGLIVSDNAYDDDDPFFIFYVSDCAFPPFYVVRGRSFEDAYEAFVDDCVERKDGSVVIDYKDPEAVKDYGLDGENPSCNFSSDGTPVCTEAVQGFEINLRAVEF